MSDTPSRKDSGSRLRDRLVAAAVIAQYINELSLERDATPALAPAA